MSHKIGIDAGGTLTKIAFFDGKKKLQLKKFKSTNVEEIISWINKFDKLSDLNITGGNAYPFIQYFEDRYRVKNILEFDATCKGVNYFLKEMKCSINNYVVTNIGTGTSIHVINNDKHSRVNGTGIGGGTLIGLSNLMTNTSEFNEINYLSILGSRKNLDLKVNDIYKEIQSPIESDLTASNFGKVIYNKSHSIPDKVASIQGMIGEVITTLSVQVADTFGADEIVYIGSTLLNNKVLQKVIAEYSIKKTKTPIFLSHHGFCGAVGALIFDDLN